MSGNANGTSHQTATLPRFDVSIPPSQPSLHAKHQSLSDVLDPKYWQQLNPGLRVGNAGFISSCKPLKPPKDRLKDLCQQINTAGVAQVRSSGLLGAARLALLSCQHNNKPCVWQRGCQFNMEWEN